VIKDMRREERGVSQIRKTTWKFFARVLRA